ncbi:hypothetical protein ACWEP3_32795, partial [Streptomyces albidoflavus]
YILTAVAGVPLIGLILGPIFKENLSWRTRNPRPPVPRTRPGAGAGPGATMRRERSVCAMRAPGSVLRENARGSAGRQES